MAMFEYSGAELNRLIAKLHSNYRIEQDISGAYLVMCGEQILGRYKKRAWAEKLLDELIPNAAGDLGLALALCLTIGKPQGWYVVVGQSDIMTEATFIAPVEGYKVQCIADARELEGGDPAALALARLALRALGSNLDELLPE